LPQGYKLVYGIANSAPRFPCVGTAYRWL